MAKWTTAAVWVRGVVDVLAAEGLDVPALLAEAGIDRATLEAPAGRVATERISRLWELAAERAGNPAIGLARHQVANPAAFDVVGYTMMSCANLNDAFERLERYLLILSDALTIIRSEESGQCRVSFELFGGSRPVPRQRVEFILAQVVTFCRWLSGREVDPVGIELSYSEPADSAPYEAAFRCRITYDAAACCLVFACADMCVSLPTSNPVLAEMHERFAGEYLRRFDAAATGYRVREVIIRCLPDGEPRRDHVARKLCLSERTLQRRLEVEATSFAELLDSTRRELAERYLGRLNLSFAQAAYLLGFADQSSFFRACRRWFELSPGQYRSQLLARRVERSGGI